MYSQWILLDQIHVFSPSSFYEFWAFPYIFAYFLLSKVSRHSGSDVVVVYSGVCVNQCSCSYCSAKRERRAAKADQWHGCPSIFPTDPFDSSEHLIFQFHFPVPFTGLVLSSWRSNCRRPATLHFVVGIACPPTTFTPQRSRWRNVFFSWNPKEKLHQRRLSIYPLIHISPIHRPSFLIRRCSIF